MSLTQRELAEKVTPFAGVWIEIADLHVTKRKVLCHSLRGSVD